MEIICNKNQTEISPNKLIWLTDDLKNKVRRLFEPKYYRSLSEAEVVEIAENLVALIEPMTRHKTRNEVISYG